MALLLPDGGAEMKYADFIERKSQLGSMSGFEPLWMPTFLFDFQKALVDWSLRKGRAAIFADCGLGKTIQQLVWAENVVRKTNRPVLILTPLAVSHQTVKEDEKFGIEATDRSSALIRGSSSPTMRSCITSIRIISPGAFVTKAAS